MEFKIKTRARVLFKFHKEITGVKKITYAPSVVGPIPDKFKNILKE